MLLCLQPKQIERPHKPRTEASPQALNERKSQENTLRGNKHHHFLYTHSPPTTRSRWRGTLRPRHTYPNNDPIGRGQVTLTSGQVNTNDFDATPRTRADGTVQKEEISYNIAEEQGFIIDARRGNAKENTPQTRTVVSLATGVLYQVVIYKEKDYDTKKIYKQATFAVGGDTPIGTKLRLGEGSYKLYAYSYNTTDAIQRLGNTGTLTVEHGQDFMDITPWDLVITSKQADAQTQVKLPTLTFQRRCCNIWVKVESVAYTNTAISACTVSLNNLPAQATWTVGGTTFTQEGTDIVAVKYFDNQESPKNKPLSKSAICLPVDKRELTMDYNFKTNKGGTGGEKTFSKTAQSLPSTDFTSGNQYLFKMTASGAYVLSSDNPVLIGTCKWARTNLKHDGTFESEPWISGGINGVTCAPNGTIATAANSYWRWDVDKPDTDGDYPLNPGSTWNADRDPCKKRGWKLPYGDDKQGDYYDLTTNYKVPENTLVYINGGVMKVNAKSAVVSQSSGAWKGPGTTAIGVVFWDSSTKKMIFFPAAGTRLYDSYYYQSDPGMYLLERYARHRRHRLRVGPVLQQ